MFRTFQLSDGSIVNYFIHDTAGQERYKSLCESYYRKAEAILLVYDISDRKSFETIEKYYCRKIKELCKKNIPVILLGNKADKEDEREVPLDEGVKLSNKENYSFKETSCLKNENVADAFETLIEMWNSGKSKNKQISINESLSLENRKRGGTFYEKSNKIDPKKRTKDCREQSFSYFDSDDNRMTIRLKRHGIKSKERKKCC